VAAHCIASCHTAHNLDSLQPHPFQILVIETIVRDHLSIVIESFNTGSCLCAHHPPTTVLFFHIRMHSDIYWAETLSPSTDRTFILYAATVLELALYNLSSGPAQMNVFPLKY